MKSIRPKPYPSVSRVITHAWTKQLCCTFALLLLFCFALSAQGRKELESKRKNLISQIQLTNRLLGETAKSKEAAYGRYLALQNQIKAREELISTLQAEIAHADANINRTSNVIFALEDDILKLEHEYGKMVRKTYRQKVTHSKLLFIFSAHSFNQAFLRWRYLKQYDAFRIKQARLIIETRQQLIQKVEQLEITRLEKFQLIDEQERHKLVLSQDMEAKNEAFLALRSDEQRLKEELLEQQRAHQELNNAIEEVIQAEMVESRKQARSTTALHKSESKPEKEGLLSFNFRSNRGRLPWPVDEGVITRHFGRQSHPTLQEIQISNNGIDIRTEKNAPVQAVFEGTVVGLQYIPGYNNMLIIKHGDYYTVYSNLKDVFVKKGDLVRTKQAVGRVSIDKHSNISEVHFEVWRDKIRLNPADWLTKR